MAENMVFIYKFILILIFCSRANTTIHSGSTPAKKLEIFPSIEKSRYIQISQLEEILISIEQTYKAMNEKQKQDAISITQVTNELQLINQRLQNIENHINQIEQAESLNKHRFELFQDGHMKEEVQFDDLKRKLEKNQQQTNNRLNEIDSSLEKIQSTQDSILKETRKSNGYQTKLSTNVEEIVENLKPDYTKLMQHMNISQHRFHQQIKDLIENSTTPRDRRNFLKVRESVDKNVSNEYYRYDDAITPDSLTLISNLNDKFTNLQEQTKSIQASVNKCINLNDDIYKDIQLQKKDVDNLLTHTQEDIVDKIKQKSNEDIERLDMTFKANFEIILQEQENFKNNCHRIQLHEERLEDKVVYILENLFTYIDNKTIGIQTELNRLYENEIKQNLHQTKELQKLVEIMNIQKGIFCSHTANGTQNATHNNEIVSKHHKPMKINKSVATSDSVPINLPVINPSIFVIKDSVEDFYDNSQDLD